MLYSSRETVSLKIKMKSFPGRPLYHNGQNETSLNPRFEWLDNTGLSTTYITCRYYGA